MLAVELKGSAVCHISKVHLAAVGASDVWRGRVDRFPMVVAGRMVRTRGRKTHTISLLVSRIALQVVNLPEYVSCLREQVGLWATRLSVAAAIASLRGYFLRCRLLPTRAQQAYHPLVLSGRKVQLRSRVLCRVERQVVGHERGLPELSKPGGLWGESVTGKALGQRGGQGLEAAPNMRRQARLDGTAAWINAMTSL